MYLFQEPNFKTLEKFDNPANAEGSKGGLVIEITAPEFSCLCPITGQPDTAIIEIQYNPDRHCVESKSFKLYLLGYRNYGTFHEACVTQIGNHLVELLDPHALKIVGRFAARGGIPFTPTFLYQKQPKVTRI